MELLCVVYTILLGKKKEKRRYKKSKTTKIMVLKVIFIVLAVLLVMAIISTLLSWYFLCGDNYTDVLMPCPGTYTIANRTYTNNLPLHSSSHPPYLLKDTVVARMRELLERVHKMFQTENISYHLSGGSLLGAVRQHTIPMHFDDDIDIHVDIKHRDRLFSRDFDRNVCRKYGLRSLFLAFNSAKSADKHGAACRLRLDDGKLMPVLDVFFIAPSSRADNKIVKIDGWSHNGKVLHESDVERWSDDTIYPRQAVVIDGMHTYLPNKPKQCLEKQYGKDVLKSIVARPLSWSHTFPFLFLQALWVSP